MSNKYKKAMDRIVVSDELKTKILNMSAEKISDNKSKSKTSKVFYLRYAIGYAACLAVFICGISAVKNNLFENKDSEISQSNYSENTEEENYYQATEKSIDMSYTDNNDKNETEPDSRSGSALLNKSENEKAERRTAVNKDFSAELNQKSDAQGDNISKSDNVPALTPENAGNNMGTGKDVNAVSSDDESKSDNDSQEPVLSGENPMAGGNGGTEMGYYIENFSNVSDVVRKVGYNFKIPKYIPKEYKNESYSLICGELIQISYESENDRLLYRTQKGSGDISGDYNVYDITETEKIKDSKVELKGDKTKCSLAIWNDNESAYSLNSEKGTEKAEMTQIIESVNFAEPKSITAEEESVSLTESKMEE